MKMTTTVHVAGQMIDGVQYCIRCQKILVDYRGAMVMDGHPMCGWEEGAFVGQCGNQSFILNHDARAGELACWPAPVERW